MTSHSAEMVTIERGYLDTLLRNAGHTSAENNGYSTKPTVVISQAEYEGLQKIARQYENLTRALLLGGVEEHILALLSRDDNTVQEGSTTQATSTSTPSRAEETEDGGARLNNTTPQRQSNYETRSASNNHSNHNNHNGSHGRHHSHGAGSGSREHRKPSWGAAGDVDEDDASCDGESPIDGPVGTTYVKSQVQGQRPQFDRECTRTIQLLNLADGTTHADITAAVRGGMLLDIFLRTHERTATISFLHAVEARRFFEHVKRNDLYIKNKRVDIKWNDRQFIMPGHVAGKVAAGASRNLVIRRYDGRHTEESIREDLDHIHNLVVIKVEFSGGNCYLSLNSVHNAIFARSCMMSRGKYKGTKIEWDVDECAQPFSAQQTNRQRKENVPPKKPLTTVANRFQLLNVDDDDEKDEEIAANLPSKQSVGIAA